MSVKLDDFAKDIVTTANGKTVAVCTNFVPWPLGRGYETGVYRCTKSGVANYSKELDARTYGKDKDAADLGHTEMINKWIKEVLL